MTMLKGTQTCTPAAGRGVALLAQGLQGCGTAGAGLEKFLASCALLKAVLQGGSGFGADLVRDMGSASNTA